MKKDFCDECCNEVCIHNNCVDKAKALMPDVDTMYDLAEFFKVFGDSTRIMLLNALSGGELCVCDLCEVLGMGQSAVSHQLRYLRTAGLVKVRREGKSAFYSLDDEHICMIMSMGIAHINHQKGNR